MSDKELIVLIILIGMLINVLIILGGNMNKQEAIDELKKHKVGFGEAASVRIDRAVSAIRQINEPQKVVVPKFVAEWIGELKESYSKLAWVWQVYPNEPKIKNWLEPNTEKFMRAWLDGYEVEKEPLYQIFMKNTSNHKNQIQQLVRQGSKWFFCGNDVHRFKTKFSKGQIEAAGFGGVFDNPMFEVEEVE